MLRAILFDLDGTLIDSAPAIAAALNEVIAARGGIPVSVEKVRGLVSRGAAELVAASFGACAASPTRDLADFRAAYGAAKADPAHLYPGAVDTLRALTDMGLRLGLCTNKPQGLTERLLEDLALRSLFSVVLGGDAVVRPKPHPAHLLDALAVLAIMPVDCFYVGDSEVDAEAAANAKIPFILARYGYALGAHDAISYRASIERLDHILTLLPNMPSHR